jgi:multidrug resistance efflux pump
LFTIDCDRFANALDQAQANLSAAEANARAAGASINSARAAANARHTEYEMFVAQAQCRQRMGDLIAGEDRSNAVSAANTALANWQQARAGGNRAGAGREQALAAVEQAQVEVNLGRPRRRLRCHRHAAARADRHSHSYYRYGCFEETRLPQLRVGDPVDVRLMDGGANLKGSITGIAQGITDSDNPTGSDLLADVNPTFNWVRLAQRVPVRIAIGTSQLPADTLIAAGMTATIEVQPHASNRSGTDARAAAPR